MKRALTLCYSCENLLDTESEQMACQAYPDGIPDQILVKGRDHRSPLPGDRGITFEPMADMTPQQVEITIRRYEESFGA